MSTHARPAPRRRWFGLRPAAAPAEAPGSASRPDRGTGPGSGVSPDPSVRPETLVLLDAPAPADVVLPAAVDLRTVVVLADGEDAAAVLARMTRLRDAGLITTAELETERRRLR